MFINIPFVVDIFGAKILAHACGVVLLLMTFIIPDTYPVEDPDTTNGTVGAVVPIPTLPPFGLSAKVL